MRGIEKIKKGIEAEVETVEICNQHRRSCWYGGLFNTEIARYFPFENWHEIFGYLFTFAQKKVKWTRFGRISEIIVRSEVLLLTSFFQ